MNYLKAKKGVEENYVNDWQAYNYKVGGKMIAIIGQDKTEQPIISLKGDVGKSEQLRQEYEDIIPGYYLNKQHWNSIYYANNRVPVELIKQLIDQSYDLVLQSLTKKKRQEINQL